MTSRSFIAALLSAVIAVLIFSPQAFALTQNFLGTLVATSGVNGRPTIAGLLIHGLVFFLIIWLVLAIMKV